MSARGGHAATLDEIDDAIADLQARRRHAIRALVSDLDFQDIPTCILSKHQIEFRDEARNGGNLHVLDYCDEDSGYAARHAHPVSRCRGLWCRNQGRPHRSTHRQGKQNHYTFLGEWRIVAIDEDGSVIATQPRPLVSRRVPASGRSVHPR